MLFYTLFAGFYRPVKLGIIYPQYDSKLRILTDSLTKVIGYPQPTTVGKANP